MALNAFPFESQDTSESQYSLLFSELQDSGVVDSADGSALRVSADSSGMHVFVAPGAAIVRGHMVVSDAVETLAINPSATSTRVDAVVLRLDPAADTISLAVKTGTPGSSTPPSLEQTKESVYEIYLGLVTVPGGAVNIGIDDVRDRRPFVGGRVGVWTTQTRPEEPRVACLGYNTETGVWEFWDGSWRPVQPSVAWSSVTGKPSTFPPSSHSHTWDQITGKPSTYPPSAHNHSADNITSGTLKAPLDIGSGSGRTTVDAGKVRVGSTLVTPQRVEFGSAGAVGPISGSLGLFAGSNSVLISGSSGRIGAMGVYDSTVSASANVYINSSGWMSRSTSSRRYKDDIQDAPTFGRVLDIRPRTWVSKNREDDGDGRHFGVIAEELADLGLEHLITRNEDGQPESVNYDRIGVALIPYVREQERRITELEAVAQRQAEQIDGLHEVVEGLLARVEALEGNADA